MGRNKRPILKVKRGNEIISAYPTGTVDGPPPVGFNK
jgi:hypothetical protein